MKPIFKTRRSVVIAAAVLIAAVSTVVITLRPLPTPPPRSIEECHDEDVLEMMVEDNEDSKKDDVSLALVRITSIHKPWRTDWEMETAHRLWPNSDLKFLLPPIGTAHVIRTLSGPHVPRTITLPDWGNDYAPPRLGEYGIVEIKSDSDHVYFMNYQHDEASPMVTAVEQYKRWASMPDQIASIMQATQVMRDSSQDPLLRLAAYYNIQYRLTTLASKRNPQAKTIANATRSTELSLLTNPDLPHGLTLAIMGNIGETWKPGQVTPQERNHAIRYLMTIVTKSRTRWKVAGAFDALGNQVAIDKSPQITEYTPEILHVLEQRTASEVAGKSLFPGFEFAYSAPYVESTDVHSISLVDCLDFVKREIHDSLAPGTKHKIITHRLPIANDDLMRKLYAAAEK